MVAAPRMMMGALMGCHLAHPITQPTAFGIITRKTGVQVRLVVVTLHDQTAVPMPWLMSTHLPSRRRNTMVSAEIPMILAPFDHS